MADTYFLAVRGDFLKNQHHRDIAEQLRSDIDVLNVDVVD